MKEIEEPNKGRSGVPNKLLRLTTHLVLGGASPYTARARGLSRDRDERSRATRRPRNNSAMNNQSVYGGVRGTLELAVDTNNAVFQPRT